MHEPTREFERYLEWQVTTALRRQDRFARPASAAGAATAGFASYLRGAPIVLVSILLGAGVVMASGRIQENQQKQVLTVQQQGELELAQVQVKIAEKNLEDAKRRSDLGVAPSDEMAAIQREWETAALRLQCARLNLQEVQRSGRPVQDDVTAPLVGGRDFVLERLDNQMRIARAISSEAEKHLQTVQKRYDVGLVPQTELLAARAALVSATMEMATFEEKIALRQKFVAGNISATDATRQRLLIASRNELRAASAALDAATERFLQVEKQMKVGVAGEVDVLKAQLEMVTRKQDITRLQERITLLEKGGPLPDGGRER